MEDRVIAAFAIIVIMGAVISWLAVRKAQERRQFKIRQSGRGKETASSPMEPAE
jgi:hypothetical protein